MYKEKNGMSLIEVLVVMGITSIIILVMLTMQDNQQKSNNYLEFQLNKIQLQNTILGQFLNNSDNCACLFYGSSSFSDNPILPGATLSGSSPTQIGRYSFVSPGDCTTALIPQPFINSTGLNGLKLNSVVLKNILKIGNSYSGEFTVSIQSTKSVSGPKDLNIQIPVKVNTSPAGGSNVNFVSCSASIDSTASASSADYSVIGTEGWERRPNGILEQWGYASGFVGSQSAITITFPQAFTNTNYNLQLTTVIPSAGDHDNYVQEINGTRTTSSVQVYSQDPSSGGSSLVSGVRWHAIGL